MGKIILWSFGVENASVFYIMRGRRLAPPCPKLAKARPVVTMGDASISDRSSSDSLFQEPTKKESTATLSASVEPKGELL